MLSKKLVVAAALFAAATVLAQETTNINTTSNSTSTNTNNNNNVNTTTSNETINQTINSNTTSNSTVNQTVNQNTTSNSTINQTVNSNNTNTNNNTNVNTTTSNNTNNNNNNNVNTNTNVNDSTVRNINSGETTTTIKSPPPSAIAPSVISNNIDLCTTGVSAAVQTQILGIAGGTTIRDLNCERLKLSKTLFDMGMKVAAVSVMCQDNRVFQAMEMAGTPCPFMGEIGPQAAKAWEALPGMRPDYEEWKKKREYIEDVNKALQEGRDPLEVRTPDEKSKDTKSIFYGIGALLLLLAL